ncbi:MAG: hypothetical protein E7244_26855 [Enterocloster citroniae]|nr:hypothetical protein [Enterocloster citroniae]
MDKNEIFENVIQELLENSLAIRREICDEEEKQHYKEVKELSLKAQAVLEKLSEEERRIVDDYFVKTNLLAQHECEYLYVQGAKDCVELLKKLGVL